MKTVQLKDQNTLFGNHEVTQQMNEKMNNQHLHLQLAQSDDKEQEQYALMLIGEEDRTAECEDTGRFIPILPLLPTIISGVAPFAINLLKKAVTRNMAYTTEKTRAFITPEQEAIIADRVKVKTIYKNNIFPSFR